MTDQPVETDRTEPIDLNTEMQRSYIEYAMSVIVSRALPDVRDGLKPVHRRVLYAMYDGGYRPDRGFNKCSRVVGDVMGQYHPHGDRRSTTPSSGSSRTGRCATRSSRARATSAPPATTPPPRPGTPSAGWLRCRWRWSATSSRRPSTSSRTTTARPSSPRSSPPASRTCSSTAAPASRSGWPRRSRRTTCARSPRPPSGCCATPRPAARRCSPPSCARSRARTSRPAR